MLAGVFPASRPAGGAARALQARNTYGGGSSVAVLVVRGDDTLYQVKMRLESGTDPYFDELWYEKTLTLRVSCDVVDVQHLIVGHVQGSIDRLGEDEHPLSSRTEVKADSGPWGNYRMLHPIATFPSSGRFELVNLMPSDVVSPPDPYRLIGGMNFRRGQRFEGFTTPHHPVEVPSATRVDIGEPPPRSRRRGPRSATRVPCPARPARCCSIASADWPAPASRGPETRRAAARPHPRPGRWRRAM